MQDALVDCVLGLIPQVVAAYFLAYLIIPRYLYTKQYVRASLYFLAGSYLICAFSRFLVIQVAEPYFHQPPKEFETTEEILTNLLKLLYVYFFRIFSVAFVFILMKLLKDQITIQERTLRLQKEKSETELKLLKTQLNPHFLFNTLNNIYSLALLQSPATAPSIGRLSGILDHVLYRCNDLYVPLSGEITLLQHYIELEKLRYDDRLKVSFCTAMEKDVPVAPLLLLSIVENAFKHGAGEDTGEPFVHVDIRVSGTFFRFEVVNSFAGTGECKNGKTIGMNNLRRQLDLLYPGQYQLNAKAEEKQFTVLLTIKLQPQSMYDENTMLAGG